MHFTTLLAATLFSTALANPVVKRQWPGKCTIGVEYTTHYYPGGQPTTGGGVNNKLENAYAYIVGSDNKQTNVELTQSIRSTGFEAHGDYGGASGGEWTVTGTNPKQSNMDDCKIRFGDVEFVKSRVGEETCDTYHYSGFAAASSGCRCRVDCV